MPELYCFRFFGVCPCLVITDFSAMCWDMFLALGGVGAVRSPQEYLSLPHAWIEAVKVMKSEVQKIEKVKHAE